MRFGITDMIKSLYRRGKNDSVQSEESVPQKSERHARIELQYDEPCGSYISDGLTFVRSNEDYKDRTIDVLCHLRGIKRYIGLCGGVTQNLFCWANCLRTIA